MPVFNEQPPWDLEWCPLCRLWYGTRRGTPRFSCCVAHAPGTCCHYGQTQLAVVEVRPVGPEGRGEADTLLL
jgi:hypothetical protein